jgi:hypothetical protein
MRLVGFVFPFYFPISQEYLREGVWREFFTFGVVYTKRPRMVVVYGQKQALQAWRIFFDVVGLWS